jgi:coproporphyrinogen III oxidase
VTLLRFTARHFLRASNGTLTTMTEIDHDEIIAGFKEVQDHIADWVVSTGNKQMYLEDIWNYAPKGDGGGRTRVWEGQTSNFMEKGGVNFSAIGGKNLPACVRVFILVFSHLVL